MSRSKKFIIVSESYLVVAGIEQLSFDITGMIFDTSFTGSEKKLVSKVSERKPDFVIVDPHSIANDNISILNELLKNNSFQVIGIINHSTSAKIIGKFNHTINIEDSKYSLAETFKKFIGKINNNEKSEDNLLSKREKEILRNLALGKTSQEIADELFLSIHTVMTHRKKITAKLGIKTSSGLTVYAIMNKLVDIREIEN